MMPIIDRVTDGRLPEPELEIEPDAPLSLEPDDIEIAMPTLTPAAALVQMPPLMDVLPSDFPLPVLIRFCPDVRLRAAAAEATAYVLGVDVTGAEGLRRVDLALTTLRERQKAITDEFSDPARLANELHKRITNLRSEWFEPGEVAIKTVGRRVWAEQQRLEQLAADERRKAQAEADRQAREQAQREAKAAEQAKAPAPIIQELQRQAETATAPPVASYDLPAMRGTSTVTTWKVRPKGTPADADPNPDIAEMTKPQIAQVLELLAAILAGKAPISAISINYSALNARAKSDRTTFAIAGFEAFQDGGVRAKGRRL